MIVYLLKVIACSGLLYAFYFFFLQKEKMLVFNRFFLLGCLIIPFLLPLVIFETTLREHLGVPVRPFEELYVVMEEPAKPVSAISGSLTPATGTVDGTAVAEVVFFCVSLLLLIRFIRNLMYYRRLLRYSTKIKKDRFSIALLDAEVPAHSFMRTIFLNRQAYERGLIDHDILLHEEVHIKQRHSLDILFTELLLVAFWFNPFLFLFKKYIRMNHEFLADAGVVRYTGDRARFQELVFKMVSLPAGAPLSSNFYLVTKKRLIMLYKETSTRVKRTKGLVAFLIFLPLLVVFAGGVNGRDLKLNAYTANNITGMLTGTQKKHTLFVASDLRQDKRVVKDGTKDPGPELKTISLENATLPEMAQENIYKDSTGLRPAQFSAISLPVPRDSAEFPYRSYPVHKGLSEEKMVEFGKFVEKYVMEDKGKKIFWYGQMLRPALDLYFGMTDEQRAMVNGKLPEIFLAAKDDRLVQVNEKYKNEDRRIIVVYPDGKTVTATVATDEERTRFFEQLGLDLGKKRNPNYTSRSYVYNGKSVAGFSMIYMAKK